MGHMRVGNSQLQNVGAQCKITMWGPLFKMIKTFKMAAAELLSLVVTHMETAAGLHLGVRAARAPQCHGGAPCGSL